MSSALSRLLMIAENYPDLKANTNFLQLQDELAGTENRIAVARMDYNGAVQLQRQDQILPDCSLCRYVRFDARDYLKQTKAQKLFRKYNLTDNGAH